MNLNLEPSYVLKVPGKGTTTRRRCDGTKFACCVKFSRSRRTEDKRCGTTFSIANVKSIVTYVCGNSGFSLAVGSSVVDHALVVLVVAAAQFDCAAGLQDDKSSQTPPPREPTSRLYKNERNRVRSDPESLGPGSAIACALPNRHPQGILPSRSLIIATPVQGRMINCQSRVLAICIAGQRNQNEREVSGFRRVTTSHLAGHGSQAPKGASVVDYSWYHFKSLPF